MRRKFTVGVGLVGVVLAVTVAVCDQMPTEPPLRVGMNEMEVMKALDVPLPLSIRDPREYARYRQGPDWLGNSRDVCVHFDDEQYRLISWDTEPLPRTRPPWLDRAMKAVGWD